MIRKRVSGKRAVHFDCFDYALNTLKTSNWRRPDGELAALRCLTRTKFSENKQFHEVSLVTANTGAKIHQLRSSGSVGNHRRRFQSMIPMHRLSGSKRTVATEIRSIQLLATVNWWSQFIEQELQRLL